MRALILDSIGGPLVLRDAPVPVPGQCQVRLRVEACGVCRTDLHILDGDLSGAKLPLIPGHEVVGRIDAIGTGVSKPVLGQRVGVPWLGATCGHCPYCLRAAENLCDAPQFTGFSRDGGFAEYCVADADYVFALSETADPVALAPLLCAGLIGYRALRMAGPAQKLGIWGFGAAAHILCQIADWQGREVFAFTRDGDDTAQAFARGLGACWAGPSGMMPPAQLDASLIFAPVGTLVPQALKSLRKGGTVVTGGIHMWDIPAFPYADLWQERSIRSVANLTRADGEEFFPLAAAAKVKTSTTA
ncbi:MAG: zinc-dependent alcohol dehydrogenase family protein [Gemmobacter sp.]|nr:zinc-dependent alcohol dehydrogenase family protein [Gemmobacter sp.]